LTDASLEGETGAVCADEGAAAAPGAAPSALARAALAAAAALAASAGSAASGETPIGAADILPEVASIGAPLEAPAGVIASARAARLDASDGDAFGPAARSIAAWEAASAAWPAS
jgi:hypothetical protein